MADDLDYLDSLLDAPFAKSTASNVSFTKKIVGFIWCRQFVLINLFKYLTWKFSKYFEIRKVENNLHSTKKPPRFL